MSINRFSHVDVRVRSLDAALEFYKKFLPELGFVYRGGQMFRVFTGEGERPGRPWFGFTEDRNHVPNTNRIAFWAGSREEIDRLVEVIRKAGGRNISGPRPCPEYSPTYYGLFFEDPSGNCLEVCHLTD